MTSSGCTSNLHQIHRYLDPIFFADYPAIMRKHAGNRLPRFSEDEITMLRGCVDFIGLNHYTSRYLTDGVEPLDELQTSYFQDQRVIATGFNPRSFFEISTHNCDLARAILGKLFPNWFPLL